jgi:DNA-binding MarR family transcriptional regulator
MQYEKLWTLAHESMIKIGESFWPDVTATVKRIGITGQWWHLVKALQHEPDPLSLQDMQRFDPYSSPKVYRYSWADLKKSGWLNKEPSLRDDVEYRLTDKGRDAAQQIDSTANSKIASLKPLPEEELTQLDGLLKKLVAFCEDTPEPADKFLLNDMERSTPEPEDHIMLFIQQSFGQLDGFHEDCYQAAWRPQKVEGFAWEAFSLICEGKAQSAEDVALQLPHRAFSANEYTIGLQSIALRGWLEPDLLGRLAPSSEGQQLWNDVQSIKNRAFFAPWKNLSEDEVSQLRRLLTRFHRSLSR